MKSLQKAGFRQLEVEVVGDNKNAIALYKKWVLLSMEETREALLREAQVIKN